MRAAVGSMDGWIDLETLAIRDYSSGALVIKSSEEDHRVIIQEFREEYLDSVSDIEEPRFSTGLFVPILPFSSPLNLGSKEILGYLQQIVDN